MGQVTGTARTLGSAPFVFSWLLAIAGAAASIASLAMPELIHGPAASVGSLRGTALVVLVIAVPVLIASMGFARRGSVVALMAWTGAVAYIGYQGVLFLFGSPFNGLFFLYLGMLSFSIWSLIALLPRIPVGGVAARFGSGTPVRAIAIYLAVLNGAFVVLWLKGIVPALFDSTAPAFLAGTGMTTGPGQILDLGFALPLGIATAVWLWQRRAWGFFLAGLYLVMTTIESLSIGADQWLGSAADPGSPAVSAAMAPLFVVIAFVGLVALGAYLRGAVVGPGRRTAAVAAPGRG